MRRFALGCALAAAAGLLPGLAASTRAADSAEADRPAGVPKDYKLLYRQNFDRPDSLNDFEFTDPAKWTWTKLKADEAGDANGPGGSGGCLESLGVGSYRPKVRSPLVIALIRGRRFGDFVLEADLQQTGREYGHRDMCLFFDFTDPSNYYYVHMATAADQNAHNIFRVHDKPRTNIAEKTTKGIRWGKGKGHWHHVRLVRKAGDGTILVFFDEMARPIMVGHDKTFAAGLVGFGSFDDLGRIDNVRIWGPKVEKTDKTFFKTKKDAEKDAKEKDARKK